MAKLYELAEAFAAIMARAEEAEGQEYAEAIPTEEIDAVFASLEDKLESCAGYCRNAEADAAAFKAEAERLAAKAARAAGSVKFIKDYMAAALKIAGKDKVKVGTFTVALQRNSLPSCTVNVPVDKLPEAFVKVIPATKAVDTAAIVDAWKADPQWEAPEGVTVAIGKHVRIR